jgi:hypothetical protein
VKIVRWAVLAVMLVFLIGLAVPYIDAGGYRERIQNALERALDRKVTVGKVRFNLLTGPGFSVDDVTIADDPSIGIEPLAYVETLSARVKLTTLWTRRLAFSNLRLENPTLNLVKADNGAWNFQLLGRPAVSSTSNDDRAREFPSIQVRSGRINFKFGDYKSIFYLADSDLDVEPLGPSSLDVRFSGQPARTDQAAQNFGRLLARGTWKGGGDGSGRIDVNAELERSSVTDLVRLLEGHGIGIHGIAASQAHLAGPITNLKVQGRLRLEDVHRWDLLPPKSGGWDLNYRGYADLRAQRIELQTDQEQDPSMPVLLRFRASDYLTDPKWAAMLELKDAPVSGFVEVARHMGASLPEGFEADGKVAGLIGFSRPGGMQGQFEVHDSSVRVGKSGAIDLRRAEFLVDGDHVAVRPSTVALADGQFAEVKGEYDAATGKVDLHVNTKEMNVAELHTGSGRLFGLSGVPFLESCRQGTLRGSLRFLRDGTDAAWSGQFEIRNARIDVDGMKDPVRLTSAAVTVAGPRLLVTQIRGRAGSVPFTGTFHRDRPGKPDRITLEIADAELSELQSLFLPALRRDAGLLARFRLRAAQIPEWLRSRHVDAAVRINKLTVGDREWTVDAARVVWDGTSVEVNGVSAQQEDAAIAGRFTIDLHGQSPRYLASGRLENLEFRGGTLTIEGTADTRGLGEDWLDGLRASGEFTGENLTLAPDAQFRTISGAFEAQPGGRLKLSGIQAAQGLDAYSGQGATQSDGRLVLELTTGKRQVRVAVAK